MGLGGHGCCVSGQVPRCLHPGHLDGHQGDWSTRVCGGALEDSLGFHLVHLGGLIVWQSAHLVLVLASERLLSELCAVNVVHVVLQLVLPLKGGTAVGAVKGTGVRMDHHVLRQGLLDAKRLVADRTPVWFLTRVCSKVHLQTGLPLELLLADLTLMHRHFVLLPHFFPQVDTLVMDRQVIMSSEALPALFTLMRFLS